MTGDSSKNVKFALKGETALSLFAAPYKKLTHVRFAIKGRFTKNITVHWHLAPSEHLHAQLVRDLLYCLHLGTTTSLILGQISKAHPVVTFIRNFKTDVLIAIAQEELVRELNEYAGSVSSNRIATATTSVIEIATNLKGTTNNIVRTSASHINDEPDPTVLPFVLRIVKPLGCW